ncbi:unnamed protein product [Cercopithifilaria johnstoni]|uniref:Pepsin inhibitor-3-like repeated domain-containing protein n=1 Tax=Cercopithifilaria johnstoni TaxID=2874296 RepID=A0A8J2Q8J0_9BILA|nr:unnamed protein product [Cercopithifilaria johnstoni]
MILSLIFYIMLVHANAVIYTEAKSVSTSSSLTVFIQHNKTVCKVQDGVLSINDKVVGNLTEEQNEELKKFINETEELFIQRFHNVKLFVVMAIINSIFETMKNVWNNPWDFSLGFFSHPSKRKEDVKESKEKMNKVKITEEGVDPLIFNVWNIPSFCKDE